jgi:transcriptional regulator with XRE-family HTH domain
LHLTFSKRLRQLRKAGGQTLAEVAECAGLAGNSVVLYLETGQRAPHLDTVEKIAYALGHSPAFLAYGVEGECPPGKELHAAGVGGRLRLARLARGFSVLALAQLAGTSHTAVGNIEKGGTMPSIATVEALAKALNVSSGWLGYGVEPQEVAPRRRVARPAAHA